MGTFSNADELERLSSWANYSVVLETEEAKPTFSRKDERSRIVLAINSRPNPRRQAIRS